MAKHQETISKFAIEIAMQLENQWVKLVYPDNKSATNGDLRNFYSQKNIEIPILQEMIKRYGFLIPQPFKMFLRTTRRFINRL